MRLEFHPAVLRALLVPSLHALTRQARLDTNDCGPASQQLTDVHSDIDSYLLHANQMAMVKASGIWLARDR